MPTFKINKTVGTLKQDNTTPNTYHFTSKSGKKIILNSIDKKIFCSLNSILLHHKDGWVKVSVNNVKKDENFKIWSHFKCDEIKMSVGGWTDRNEPFVMATYDDGNRLIMLHGGTIIDTTDDQLTMVVYQRNSPGTSRFDCTWCFHDKHECLTTVHDKTTFDSVNSIISDITDNVFDNGRDPYDWKTFLKTQDKQKGDEDDWVGVFAPLTSDDEADEDEEEEYVVEEEVEEEGEEEYDDEDEETEYESSEYGLETASEVSSDDMEGEEYVSEEEYTPVKRRRLF
jgi:nucleosome binding factor SPN SPT16 subunit